MNELNERIEKIIREKSYDDLTPDEKTVLEQQGIDRIQFDMLQSIEDRLIKQGVGEMEMIRENPGAYPYLKSRIIEIKNRGSHSILNNIRLILHYRVRAYQAGLISFILIFAAWFSGMQHSRSAESKIPPQVIIKTDTVYMTSLPDTVTVEKLVYAVRPSKSIRGTKPDNPFTPTAGNRENDYNYDEIFQEPVGLTLNENGSIPEFIVSDK